MDRTEAEPGPITFSFKNIGPITNADLELGSLTVIAGRNNTGKTYLVYTLYGFLKMWDTIDPARDESKQPGTRSSHWVVDEIYKQLVEKGEATVALNAEGLKRERRTLMRALTRSFSAKALAMVFNSSVDAFKHASIAVNLGPGLHQHQPAEFLQVRAGEMLSAHYDGVNVRISGGSPGKNNPAPGKFYYGIQRFYLRFLFPELALEPFVLSAERFGISLFYKELDFTKNQLVDLLQKIGDRKRRDRFPFLLIDESLSRYALPIKHNINYTRGIFDIRKQHSEVYDEGLFNEIRDLMNGYYRASDANIEFRSSARGSRRFVIPLHLASSSARGLSDLYFFLRHMACKDHLVIIDEPEGHLDTTNQRLLARLLARMVRVGLKVLVTTHSDYLIKEINNLVMLNNPVFSNKPKIVEELGYKESDCISPQRIRAYIAENNGLTKCRVDEFGIEMPNFDRTIDDINRVANNLASCVAEGVNE